MKSLRWMLAAALVSLSTLALSQADGAKSEAAKSFEQMKTLAGTWEGHVTTVPAMAEMGNDAVTQVSMRVTSRGNSMVHEMRDARNPDGPAKYDHAGTMCYEGGERLM